MCGIAGFIGHPKKAKLSYELITCLFEHLETRGVDAAGYWGTEVGNKILYHKQPSKSSDFIKTEHWNKLRKLQLNMMLVHARATSKGGGHASINSNNHPFVNSNTTLAMVHNGTLDEATFLKDKYETLSQTDSEYLLRMYEHGLDTPYYAIEGVPVDIAKKMNGIKDIWSCISSGAMAVGIGERVDKDTRDLFLFRNEKRPMWLADLRRVLGQVFFFSSPDIWYRAMSDKENLKKTCWGEQKLIELPPNQIWYMRIDKEDPIVTDENLIKLKVDAVNNGKVWDKGEYCHVKTEPRDTSVDIVCGNDEEPKPIVPIIRHAAPAYVPPAYTAPTSNTIHNKGGKKRQDEKDRWYWNNAPEEKIAWDDPKVNHAQICEEIIRLAQQIDTVATNLSIEGSMSASDYQLLLESLEQHKSDLEATLRIVNPV